MIVFVFSIQDKITLVEKAISPVIVVVYVQVRYQRATAQWIVHSLAEQAAWVLFPLLAKKQCAIFKCFSLGISGRKMEQNTIICVI